MSIPLGHYLILAAILFAIGLAGALTRKNAIIVLMGVEVMFNSAILNLVAFWHFLTPRPLAWVVTTGWLVIWFVVLTKCNASAKLEKREYRFT